MAIHTTALGGGIAFLLTGLFAIPAFAKEDTRLENKRDEDGIACLPRLPRQLQQFEQNIGSGLRLIFRKTEYFLVYLADQHDKCGAKKEMTVISKLISPDPSPGQWSGASFDCVDPSRTVTRGKPFIGIFSIADNSTKTKALRGWTVDFRKGVFIPVDGAICHSFDK